MSVLLSEGPMPRHIAFIMDGNGRWARRQGLKRLRGHQEGAKALRRITTRCRELGVCETTFYALSTENFARRPREEIAFLMRLLESYLIDERPTLMENCIRLQTLGYVQAFSDRVRRVLDETVRLTADNTGMLMRLALNYGSRQEILEAVRKIARAARAGELSADAIDHFGEEEFAAWLEDPGMTDPDLVVRTAGEYRLSNFLLWQSSYSELYITEQLWPEFDVAELERAIASYQQRDRKYGAVSPRRERENA